MQDVASLGAYRSLVGAVYRVAEARADDRTYSNQFCIFAINPTPQCFAVNDGAMYHFTVHPTSVGYQQRLDSLGVYLIGEVGIPRPIPDSLVADMQAVGLFAPDMFMRWPLPGRQCVKQGKNFLVFLSC